MEIGSVGGLSGIYGAGGQGRNKDMLEEMLASLELSIEDFVTEEGGIDAEKLRQALGGDEFMGGNPMDGGRRPGPPDFNSEEFQQGFANRFGEDALESVQNDDGSIDPSAMRAFMQEQGMGPPMGGLASSMQGGVSGAPLANQTLSTLIEMLATGSTDEGDSESLLESLT